MCLPADSTILGTERKTVMKRTISLALCLLMLLVSCGSGGSENPSETTADTAVETQTETETEEVPELPADLDLTGSTFTFGVLDNPNARNPIVMEELTGEALNDAQYNTIEGAEEMLGVTIGEYLIEDGYPATTKIRSIIQAGDDIIQVANLYCAATPVLLADGYVLDYNDIPIIDLSKSWWDQSVNQSLMLGDMRYAAIGDLSITTHDLSFVLLFSKAQIDQNGLESPYDLVKDGKWTMDKMQEMMEIVTVDSNGDTEFTNEDTYGYLGTIKNVLPSFWIGAGEVTIALNDDGIPEMSMSDERFVSVIDRIFAMTYDNNARFLSQQPEDVNQENINMFQENKGLFMDCSLFWVTALRDMETDFGIIPYPMWNEEQGTYYSRVSYFMPPLVPISNSNLELTGAVLEVTNYLAKQSITPAYYDISLKGKYSRDEESVAMLDLIFDNRVVDLGDTIFCPDVRDGFFSTMYKSNKRDLVSQVEKNSPKIQTTIDKMVSANQ